MGKVPDLTECPNVVAVIPARDEAESIHQAVTSLLKQSFLGSLKIIVVDDLKLTAPSTKAFAAMLSACGATGGKILFVQATADTAVVKSGRNIAGVTMTTAGTVGTYEIMASDILVLTSSGVETLGQVHGA